MTAGRSSAGRMTAPSAFGQVLIKHSPLTLSIIRVRLACVVQSELAVLGNYASIQPCRVASNQAVKCLALRAGEENTGRFTAHRGRVTAVAQLPAVQGENLVVTAGEAIVMSAASPLYPGASLCM